MLHTVMRANSDASLQPIQMSIDFRIPNLNAQSKLLLHLDVKHCHQILSQDLLETVLDGLSKILFASFGVAVQPLAADVERWLQLTKAAEDIEIFAQRLRAAEEMQQRLVGEKVKASRRLSEVKAGCLREVSQLRTPARRHSINDDNFTKHHEMSLYQVDEQEEEELESNERISDLLAKVDRLEREAWAERVKNEKLKEALFEKDDIISDLEFRIERYQKPIHRRASTEHLERFLQSNTNNEEVSKESRIEGIDNLSQIKSCCTCNNHSRATTCTEDQIESQLETRVLAVETSASLHPQAAASLGPLALIMQQHSEQQQHLPDSPKQPASARLSSHRRKTKTEPDLRSACSKSSNAQAGRGSVEHSDYFKDPPLEIRKTTDKTLRRSKERNVDSFATVHCPAGAAVYSNISSSYETNADAPLDASQDNCLENAKQILLETTSRKESVLPCINKSQISPDALSSAGLVDLRSNQQWKASLSSLPTPRSI